MFLLTIIWHHVFQSNTNNLKAIVSYQVLLSRINRYFVSCNYFYSIIMNCLSSYMVSRDLTLTIPTNGTCTKQFFPKNLWRKRDHPIPDKRPDLVLIDKKKSTKHLGEFDANHREKVKENEKIDEYLDLTRELKKLWNMQLTLILTARRFHEMVPIGLEKRWEE